MSKVNISPAYHEDGHMLTYWFNVSANGQTKEIDIRGLEGGKDAADKAFDFLLAGVEDMYVMVLKRFFNKFDINTILNAKFNQFPQIGAK